MVNNKAFKAFLFNPKKNNKAFLFLLLPKYVSNWWFNNVAELYVGFDLIQLLGMYAIKIVTYLLPGPWGSKLFWTRKYSVVCNYYVTRQIIRCDSPAYMVWLSLRDFIQNVTSIL